MLGLHVPGMPCLMQRPAMVYDQEGVGLVFGELMETGSRQALKQERHDLRSEDLAQAGRCRGVEGCMTVHMGLNGLKVRLDLREHVLRTLGPPEDSCEGMGES